MPDRLQRYNAIATYIDSDRAHAALSALHDEGIESGSISYLGRRAEEAVATHEAHEEAADAPVEVASEVAKKGAAGGAIGGVAGFLAGAAAFGIPGIGPAVGVGIWATTVGGATAGSVAGGMIGGIGEMWEKRYRSAVAEGRVLVGVHTDNASEGERARKLLDRERPERLDILDSEGRLVAEEGEGGNQ